MESNPRPSEEGISSYRFVRPPSSVQMTQEFKGAVCMHACARYADTRVVAFAGSLPDMHLPRVLNNFHACMHACMHAWERSGDEWTEADTWVYKRQLVHSPVPAENTRTAQIAPRRCVLCGQQCMAYVYISAPRRCGPTDTWDPLVAPHTPWC